MIGEQKPIRVLIVDDHAIVCKGIKTLLLAYSELEFVGEATNGAEAINLCNELQPDVILMDLVMPGIGGISAIRTIHQINPEVQILALTNFDEEDLIKDAIEAGAGGYLLKNIAAEELARAIRMASTGKAIIAPEATQALFNAMNRPPAPGQNLTEREQQILSFLAKGWTNSQIAYQLEISPLTIKNHVAHILNKLNVSTRTEAATLALRHNIVQMD